MVDIREGLRELMEGADFTPPDKLLGNLKAEDACKKLPAMPYSIATNVAHADIWNRVWLSRLKGLEKMNPFPDFPDVTVEEWPAVRDTFLANLHLAKEIAEADPFVHGCRNDELARKRLLEIIVHTSYHVGQVSLLKRALRAKV